MTQQPCGCLHLVDESSGVLKSYQKCARHLALAGRKGYEYYQSLGAIKDNVPQNWLYETELKECLDELGQPLLPSRVRSGMSVLEIGAGLAGYCPMFLRAGFQYTALEIDAFAVDFIQKVYGVPVFAEHFEVFGQRPIYDIVLAAHVFEHLADSPHEIRHAVQCLVPGGLFICIVPNDDDLCNPDHLWFYNEKTLLNTLVKAGLEPATIGMCTKRRVPQELFIYAVGRTPVVMG